MSTTRYAVAIIDKRTGKQRRIGVSGKGTDPNHVHWLHRAHRRTFTDAEYRNAARPFAKVNGYGLVRYRINPYPWLVLDADTALPKPELARALNELGRRIKRPLFINEGWRTRARQEALWAQGIRQHGYPGVTRWVARPGSSPHEGGNAADVQVAGVNLANYPGARAIAAELGLVFRLSWEPWHVELAR